MSEEFWARPVAGAGLVLRLWYRQRGEAWSAMGTDPISGADVREELEAMGIEDAAERSRIRRLVAFVEDGYHRQRIPPDEAEKEIEKQRDSADALEHYRARAKSRPAGGVDLASLRRRQGR